MKRKLTKEKFTILIMLLMKAKSTEQENRILEKVKVTTSIFKQL